MTVIHLAFLGIAFGVILNHPDYVKWPAIYSSSVSGVTTNTVTSPTLLDPTR